jgi:hypothetical protein
MFHSLYERRSAKLAKRLAADGTKGCDSKHGRKRKLVHSNEVEAKAHDSHALKEQQQARCAPRKNKWQVVPKTERTSL